MNTAAQTRKSAAPDPNNDGHPADTSLTKLLLPRALEHHAIRFLPRLW